MARKSVHNKQHLLVAKFIELRAAGCSAPVREAAEAVGLNYDYARKIFTFPHIRQFLQEKDAETTESALYLAATSKQRILEEYARIGFLDPKKLYDEFGNLKPINEIDDDTARAIGSVKVRWTDSGTETEFKIIDKKGALDSMARVAGMFNDKIQVGVTFNDILKEVAEMGGSSEPLVDMGGGEDDE